MQYEGPGANLSKAWRVTKSLLFSHPQYSGYYSISEDGICGIAPCWVHTKADTSTALL